MNKELILKEIEIIKNSLYAQKTDKQLESYEILSQERKGLNKGIQPDSLLEYYKSKKRNSKLTIDEVKEIRHKYIPHIYGKLRLAKEYGVSASVIYRIVNFQSWKCLDST